MCLGALFQARIAKLYFGCHDHKRSAASAQSVFKTLKGTTELCDNNHKLEIHGGVLADECSILLKDFFKRGRRGVPPRIK